MNNNFLVSVIIPVYNCDRYLAEAIQSVLAQTYQPLEIIVVDDGSEDRTAEIAKSFSQSLQYIYQPNQGTAAARNYGISLAKGNFLAFLDADDLWLENKLALQMAAFMSNPQADIIFGQVQQFHSPELDDTIKNQVYCPSKLQPGHIPSTMVIKRASFCKIGQFESQWQLAEFFAWYVRATELKSQIVTLPELIAKRRLHKTNKGIRHSEIKSEYLHILKNSLNRRRQMID